MLRQMCNVNKKQLDKERITTDVGVLKSGMHTAVLKEVNSTCECFSKEVKLEEFEAYFEVLESEGISCVVSEVRINHS